MLNKTFAYIHHSKPALEMLANKYRWEYVKMTIQEGEELNQTPKEEKQFLVVELDLQKYGFRNSD